jgi:dUTP pyrophosphatase
MQSQLNPDIGKCRVFLEEGAQLPSVQTPGAAGYDLTALEDITLVEGETTFARTGVFLELPEGVEAQVRPRSGLSAKGVIVLNSPGTIDCDYRGEVKVIMTCLPGFGYTPPFTSGSFGSSYGMRRVYTIKAGERIAQMVFAPVLRMQFDTVNTYVELTETTRGAGGFGSTGK